MNFSKDKKGFTIIETLVAISILLISVTASLTLTTDSLRASFFARDQITASFLAQEGVELVRNISNTNVLNNISWVEGIGPGNSDVCFNSNGCFIVISDTNLSLNPTICSSGNCPFLKYNLTTKKYGHTIGIDSIFKRKINLNLISTNEVEIISNVSWATGKLSKEIVIKERIYNWQCILSSSGC